jgi:diguanylate cyclase (GGDEF)-like protein
MPNLMDGDSERPLIRALAAAVATAAVVAGAGGGEAFWVCVPVSLFVSSNCAEFSDSVLGALATILVAAAAASVAGSLPASIPLALLVPAASVGILLRVRARLERERDAMRAGALSDPLTGIANRRVLTTRIEYEIARHTRSRRSFAIATLDLDGFKQLNDRYGHSAGDALLREVARALTHATREQDTVARVGGDEFCVLAPETDRAGTHGLAARALEAIASVTAGREWLGAGIGVAVFPDDARSPRELLETADERLLESKRRRRAERDYGRAA